MKHWYLQDGNGNNIGNISLEEGHADEISKGIIMGTKFMLGGAWREGSNDLAWFTVVPEPVEEMLTTRNGHGEIIAEVPVAKE